MLVAGSNLTQTEEPFPNQVLPSIKYKLNDILQSMRPASARIARPTDDFNDLDYAGADMRLAVRRILIKDMGAIVLGN